MCEISPKDNLFSVYAWARSHPVREDVTYVMSSFIGRDLTQP